MLYRYLSLPIQLLFLFWLFTWERVMGLPWLALFFTLRAVIDSPVVRVKWILLTVSLIMALTFDLSFGFSLLVLLAISWLAREVFVTRYSRGWSAMGASLLGCLFVGWKGGFVWLMGNWLGIAVLLTVVLLEDYWLPKLRLYRRGRLLEV